MIEKTMLAMATMALCMAALPGLAAADPHMDLPENPHFTVTGGEAKLEASGSKITCQELTGTGEFKNNRAGTIQLAFHGCKGPFTIHCTTEGQETATITTTELTFHLRTVTEGEPALLITSNQGHFATFECSAFFHYEVDGNGIIGEITEPGYEEASSTATVKFSGAEGEQVHTTVKGEETEYGLETILNEGEPESAVQVAEGQMHFTEGEGTLTRFQTLTIIKAGSGGGTVTSEPEGIVCVPACTEQTAIFEESVVVTLEAEAAEGSEFSGWETVSGNPGACKGKKTPCEVQMNEAVVLKARFE